MSTRLRGSVLTCAMLARGDKQVLCAVSNVTPAVKSVQLNLGDFNYAA